jgi:hypothetical protein
MSLFVFGSVRVLIIASFDKNLIIFFYGVLDSNFILGDEYDFNFIDVLTAILWMLFA